jgi:hypothetical protein
MSKSAPAERHKWTMEVDDGSGRCTLAERRWSVYSSSRIKMAVLHKPLGIMIRQDSINIPNIAEVQYIVKFPFGNLARTSFGMQGTVKNCKKSLFRKECKSL